VEGAEAQIADLSQQRNESRGRLRRQGPRCLGAKRPFSTPRQRQELVKAAQRTGCRTLRAPSRHRGAKSVNTMKASCNRASRDGPSFRMTEARSRRELPKTRCGFRSRGQSAELKIGSLLSRAMACCRVVRSVSRDCVRNERKRQPRSRSTLGKIVPRDGQNSPPAEAAYVDRISMAENSMETSRGRIPLGSGMTIHRANQKPATER